MLKKKLYIFLFIILIIVTAITVILIRVRNETVKTISQLKQQQIPHKLTFTNISIKKRENWKLYVDRANTQDIIFKNKEYYIATTGGIIVLSLDGKRVKEYNVIYNLPENSFLTLIKEKNNNIYALTEGGKLIKLKDNSYIYYDTENLGRISGITKRGNDILISSETGVYFLRNDRISMIANVKNAKIAKDLDNGLVIGTTTGNVYIKTTTLKDSISNIDAVYDIEKKNDTIYIATPIGLETFSDKKNKIKMVGEFITTIADYNGKIYLGTYDGKVIGGNEDVRVADNNIHINKLKVLQGKLFALTTNGVYILDGKRWKIFYKPFPNSPINYVTSLAANNGNLFIGTFEDGCFSLGLNDIKRVNIAEGVNEINEILCEDNTIFLATNSGAFVFNSGGIKKIEGLPSHFVTSLFIKDRTLFVGTSRGFGLLNLTQHDIKIFGSFQGLINNRVYCITATATNTIIGTLGGISVFDGNDFKNFTSANSQLKSNWINALISAGDKVYIGTYGGGIAYLDKTGIHNLEKTEGIEINHNALYYRKPYLLAGTCKNGLYIYNEETKMGQVFKDLFPLDNVTGIFTDEEHLYIGTEQGLFQIGIKELLKPGG